MTSEYCKPSMKEHESKEMWCIWITASLLAKCLMYPYRISFNLSIRNHCVHWIKQNTICLYIFRFKLSPTHQQSMLFVHSAGPAIPSVAFLAFLKAHFFPLVLPQELQSPLQWPKHIQINTKLLIRQFFADTLCIKDETKWCWNIHYFSKCKYLTILFEEYMNLNGIVDHLIVKVSL